MSDDYGLDILAFAPHPDDAEMCCGGLLLQMAAKGYRTGIVDLTRGELGSNGTVEDREREAAAAAQVLGLSVRENLGLPDGWLSPWAGEDASPADRASQSQVAQVAEVLRRLRPELVLLPWRQGRHPDHRAAHHLIERALFLSYIHKFETSPQQPRFRPRQVLYYQMRYRFRPSFVVDISDVVDQKQAAIQCYESQFQRGPGTISTLINASSSQNTATLRDQYYGAMLGVAHAEAYLCPATLGLVDPIAHFRSHGDARPQLFEDEL